MPKEGDLMKRSAKNLPSMSSARIDSQRSALSNYKSLKNIDSMLSLFNQIPTNKMFGQSGGVLQHS